MEHKQTIEVLKALADDIRLGIVRKLAAKDEPVPGCDIVRSCASFLKLSQPAMSHHFNKLVDAGVLLEEKDGTSKQYRVDKARLIAMGVDVDKL